MIVHASHLQVIGCTICEEVVELRRTVNEAPELVAMVKQQMEQDHKSCEGYEGKPELARAARKFCAGMREAFEQPQRPPDRVRPMYARCRRSR